MAGCVTGKNQYDSEELAREALIENRIRNNHRDGTGPINIYQCSDCQDWHFTSTGQEADFLHDPMILERIRRQRQLLDWTNQK
ncbi:MAG: hypothetical protein ABJP45_03040 [Cyclobacteriaceae bacterium]